MNKYGFILKESGWEKAFYLLQLFSAATKLPCMFCDDIAGKIRCHDKDGIFAVDRFSLSISKATFIKELLKSGYLFVVNVIRINNTQGDHFFFLKMKNYNVEKEKSFTCKTTIWIFYSIA